MNQKEKRYPKSIKKYPNKAHIVRRVSYSKTDKSKPFALQRFIESCEKSTLATLRLKTGSL